MKKLIENAKFRYLLIMVMLSAYAFGATGDLFKGATEDVNTNMTSLKNLIANGFAWGGIIIALVGGGQIAIANSQENAEAKHRGINILITGIALGAVGAVGKTLKI